MTVAAPAMTPHRPGRFRALLRWAWNLTRWFVILVIVLILSSFVAYGLGQFIWLARGKPGSTNLYRDRAMTSFQTRVAPARPTRSRPVDPLNFATLSTGMLLNGRQGLLYNLHQWGVWDNPRDGRGGGYLLFNAPASYTGIRKTGFELYRSAPPVAVYQTTGLAHTVSSFSVWFEASAGKPFYILNRATWGWRQPPEAISWSVNDTKGRLVAVWVFHDRYFLADIVCESAGFGRAPKRRMVFRMFHDNDALYESRRETGGLMMTDPFAQSIRDQLSDPAHSATKRVFALKEDVRSFGEEDFEEMFGFGFGDLDNFVKSLNSLPATRTSGR